MGYIYNALDNYFIKSNTSDTGIPQLMWHITNLCRLHCKFCFSAKNADEVDINDLNKYTRQFKALKVQKIDLSGGEPMLYSFFPEICEALSKADICITVTTRAVGLETNANWVLHNWDKFTRVIVSVDVPSVQSFMELSMDREAWYKTENFLQQLKDRKCTNIRVNTVVTPYLLDGFLLNQLAEIIEQYDCNEWCLIEAHPANKKDTFDKVKISHEQFLHIVEKAKKIWEVKSDHRLLVREQMNYTDYWVLYPDGILAKHTSGEQDDEKLFFLDTPIDEILHRTKDKIWVPEAKYDI